MTGGELYGLKALTRLRILPASTAVALFWLTARFAPWTEREKRVFHREE